VQWSAYLLRRLSLAAISAPGESCSSGQLWEGFQARHRGGGEVTEWCVRGQIAAPAWATTLFAVVPTVTDG
jgi:hypothetical protein